MVKSVYYDRGDIVLVKLAPTVGRELMADTPRPVLVLSRASFNTLGICLAAPITTGGQSARHAGFAVSLTGCGTQTQGVVAANMIRTLDLAARGAKKVEIAPDYIVEDVLAKVAAIIE